MTTTPLETAKRIGIKLHPPVKSVQQVIRQQIKAVNDEPPADPAPKPPRKKSKPEPPPAEITAQNEDADLPLERKEWEEFAQQVAFGVAYADAYQIAFPDQSISRDDAHAAAARLVSRNKIIDDRIRTLKQTLYTEDSIARIVADKGQDLKLLDDIARGNSGNATPGQRLDALARKHKLLGWERPMVKDKAEVPAAQVEHAMAKGRDLRNKWLLETGQQIVTWSDGARTATAYGKNLDEIIAHLREIILDTRSGI